MGRIVVGKGKHAREIQRRPVASSDFMVVAKVPEDGSAFTAPDGTPATTEKVVEDGEVWEIATPPELHPELADAIKDLKPKEVALFCAWVMNGRNITGAARQIGMKPAYAQRLFSVHPGIRAAIDWLHNIVLPEDQDWTLLLPQARRTIATLLDARDEKVRFWAAKDIADRAEGKPTARLDMTIRDERPSLSEGELQLLFSIMQATGVSYAEAVTWIRSHPDDVQQWVGKHVSRTLLPPVASSDSLAVTNGQDVTYMASGQEQQAVQSLQTAAVAARGGKGSAHGSQPSKPPPRPPLLAFTQTPP